MAVPPTSELHGDRRDGDVVRRVHVWLLRSTSDFVVVHRGDPPSADDVETALEALHGSVDRGEAAVVRGAREIPDICIADDGRDVAFSRTWQTLHREGLTVVTLDNSDPGATMPGGEESTVDPFYVIRRRSVLDIGLDEEAVVWRRPSWWAAALVVVSFAVWQLVEIARRRPDGGEVEARWLEAARRGTVDGTTATFSGTGLWPATMQSIVDAFGPPGVRITSLVFAVVAVACLSNAASRLYGRWAARTTAVVTIAVLTGTGLTTEATPAMLSVLALAVCLQGIALGVVGERPSWMMMSGAAGSLAVAVQYESFVIVVGFALTIRLLGGERRRQNLQVFTLFWSVCTLWWFLPLNVSIGSYVSVVWSTLRMPPVVALLAVTVVGLGLAGALRAGLDVVVSSELVRRRLIAVAIAAPPVVVLRWAAGVGVDAQAIATVGALVAPTVGGLVAHLAAARTAGTQIVPTHRTAPDLLKVDPSTGSLSGNHIVFTNRQMVLAGALLAASALWFFPWALGHVMWTHWWLAIPFLVCNALVAFTAGLLVYNNARQSIPLQISVAVGHEPLVGVIVPTVDEPVAMVTATIRSILEQDWPIDRLRIVVSDDGQRDEMYGEVLAMSHGLPEGVLTYHRPPPRGSPRRYGESKAGNLNSAIIQLNALRCDYIETRDADDLVGCSNFLRTTIGHMMSDDRIGYVQTIKESVTSDGDPFNNNEILFYRGMMLARNRFHAPLPCGSGLVWRRAALRDIGHFPIWNLVEDIHSGVLAQRLGWRGLYVPVVGAMAQHAPEDVANYFKQRGTWALDSVRLVVFDRFRGIGWRARLQLLEQTAFYLLSLPVMGLLVIPILGLVFGLFPIEADTTDYALHFTGFAVSMELCMFAFATDKPLHAYVRTRLFLVGMAPLYFASVVRALWYGAKRKPMYIVTRKTNEHRVYFRLLRTHWILITLICASLVVGLVRRADGLAFDPGVFYWAFAGVAGLGSFVRLGWFGVDIGDLVRRRRG